MRPTHSSFDGTIVTSLEAALFTRHFCAMCDTDSSLNNLFGTSLEAASFHLCAMRDANSTLLDLIVTSLEAASFPLCAMRDTNSSLLDIVGTSLKAALHHLHLCAMCDANSPFALGKLVTSRLLALAHFAK
jgi:hypothetical protein